MSKVPTQVSASGRWFHNPNQLRTPCTLRPCGDAHEPKVISKEFTRVLGSEPNFYDVHGASIWTSVLQKVRPNASEH